MTTPTLLMNVETLRACLGGPAAPHLLDVRTPAEFETAHIPGSHNVPLETLREHRAELLGHLDEQVVLVCRSGRRAGQAEGALAEAGLPNLRVLHGGMLARLPYNRGPRQDITTILAQLTAAGRTP